MSFGLLLGGKIGNTNIHTCKYTPTSVETRIFIYREREIRDINIDGYILFICVCLCMFLLLFYLQREKPKSKNLTYQLKKQ